MKRVVSIIIYASLILTIAALDSAFFPALGGIWLYMNVSLATGLFLVVVLNRKIAMMIYLGSMVLIGFSASQMIILPLILGSFILLAIDWLIESVFTNRSYYTLIALGLLGWAVYYFVYGAYILLLRLISNTALVPELSLGWAGSIVANAVLVYIIFSIAYVFIHYMSKRFRSYFILSDH